MSLLIRLAIVSIIAGLVVGAALAASGTASASNSTARTNVVWHITGPKIYFDKKETQKISVGGGAVATFAVILPPPFDVVVAGISAAVAAKAGLAAVDGNCIGVRILPPLPFVPPAVPFTYRPSDKKVGRYCR